MIKTTVVVTDIFKVEIDNYGNHQPVYFRPGGDVITVGKSKGQLTKDKWIKEDKYFKNVARAIYYGVENGIIGDIDATEEVSLDEYLVRLGAIYKQTEYLLMDSKEES